MLFDDWELDVEEEFRSFRDRTTLDGQDGDDEQIRDRELEFLSDHDICGPPRVRDPRPLWARPRQALATSGYEAEHPGPERTERPGGTSGFEQEHGKGDDDDASDHEARGSDAAGKAD